MRYARPALRLPANLFTTLLPAGCAEPREASASEAFYGPRGDTLEGGRNGVTLNAPKGMALQGDTLWLADIEVIRGFHRTTGRPLRTITLPMPVTLLNDVAVSPDGTMYITDNGIEMTDKGVKKPGGDALTPEAGDGEPAMPIATGPGRFDGIEVLADGTMLVSAWNDHALHMISPDDTDRRIVGALTQPADIGVDTRRNRVAIPQVLRGVVDFWTLPGGS